MLELYEVNYERKFLIEVEDDIIVNGDFNKIKQLFTNLISNAIKYSHDGSKLKIRARTINDNVEVMIEDEGIGISEEDIPNLFSKFYRLGKGSKFFFILPINVN